jgi:hypothetical protein
MELVISGSSSAQVRVVESGNTVVVTKPLSSIVSIATPGPQGPAYAGVQYFNIGAIDALTVANSGVTLKWNGAQFIPTGELSDNMTVNGGAF